MIAYLLFDKKLSYKILCFDSQMIYIIDYYSCYNNPKAGYFFSEMPLNPLRL